MEKWQERAHHAWRTEHLARMQKATESTLEAFLARQTEQRTNSEDRTHE